MPLGFKGLGVKGLGVKCLGFQGLGFRVLVLLDMKFVYRGLYKAVCSSCEL